MPTASVLNGHQILTFQCGSASFRIAPESGCRLLDWHVRSASGSRAVIHWPDGPLPARLSSVRGGNPLLFPFAGRTYDRGIEYAWRDPNGVRRPMPRHGFCRDGRFDIESCTENALCCRFVPQPADAEAYPFDYTFKVSYTFGELAFKVAFELINHDSAPIPWSAGHHFYFQLPWHAAATRADYRLLMDARKAAYHGPDGKLVPTPRPEHCMDFADPALNDRIHWQLRHPRVSFGPRSGEEDVHLIFGTQPPPKNLAVVTWSAADSAPYYCVEPWMGPPNAAEHGKGLHWVAPASSALFEVEVSLF